MLRPLALALLAAVSVGCAGTGSPSEPAPLRRVSVTGRFVTAYAGRPAEGVYGLRVRLLFRRADGAWEALPGRLRRHRQFDVLGEDGAFRFDVTTDLDLSRYDSLAVVPTVANATLHLVPHPAGSQRVGPDVVFPLAEGVRAAIPDAGPVVVEGLEREVRREVGVVVRTMELGREFVGALYGGAVPFELLPVRVELSPGGGYVFQALDPDVLGFGGHEIELNTSRGITPTTVAHEYGHYVTFRMWGADPIRYSLRNRSLREGWAIFFSFATRAYTAATYGDVDLAPSNPERAPFTDRFAGDRRYLGISYGDSRPTYSAIGSLLWSLYDGAAPSPLEYEGDDAASLAGDNDDVAGGLALVEAVRQSRTSVFDEVGVVEVVRTFRAAMPAGLGPSIDGAVAFFLCPAAPECDVTRPSDGTPATAAPTLRPVPPGALAARRRGTRVLLRWTSRTYATPWANRPEAYRVFREGALVATLPPEATGWVDEGAGAGEVVYEVRAVGGGGESFGSPSVRVPPEPPVGR